MLECWMSFCITTNLASALLHRSRVLEAAGETGGDSADF